MDATLADALDTTREGRFLQWVNETRDLLGTHEDLWAWSVADLGAFWQAVWDYFEVQSHSPHTTALASREMPGASWFPGATLNYAEHMLGTSEDTDRVAVVGVSQTRADVEATFGETGTR